MLIQVELKGANDNELQAYTLTGKQHTRKLYRASRHHLKTVRWTSLTPTTASLCEVADSKGHMILGRQ